MAKEYLTIDGKLVTNDGKLVQVPDTENLNDLADEGGITATQALNLTDEIEDLIVNGVIDGSPKGVYANLTELQTAYPNGASGVYLTSDNGHWYYYNDGWQDGGEYRANDLKFRVEQLESASSYYDSWINNKLRFVVPYPTDMFTGACTEVTPNENGEYILEQHKSYRIFANKTESGTNFDCKICCRFIDEYGKTIDERINLLTTKINTLDIFNNFVDNSFIFRFNDIREYNNGGTKFKVYYDYAGRTYAQGTTVSSRQYQLQCIYVKGVTKVLLYDSNVVSATKDDITALQNAINGVSATLGNTEDLGV